MLLLWLWLCDDEWEAQGVWCCWLVDSCAAVWKCALEGTVTVRRADMRRDELMSIDMASEKEEKLDEGEQKPSSVKLGSL